MLSLDTLRWIVESLGLMLADGVAKGEKVVPYERSGRLPLLVGPFSIDPHPKYFWIVRDRINVHMDAWREFDYFKSDLIGTMYDNINDGVPPESIQEGKLGTVLPAMYRFRGRFRRENIGANHVVIARNAGDELTMAANIAMRRDFSIAKKLAAALKDAGFAGVIQVCDDIGKRFVALQKPDAILTTRWHPCVNDANARTFGRLAVVCADLKHSDRIVQNIKDITNARNH